MMRESSGGFMNDSHSDPLATVAAASEDDLESHANAVSSSGAREVDRTNSLREYRRFIGP